jgi:2-oxoglutarate dehydrogenase E2 component (dihydrolipoamide succinyltransferase)
VDQGEGEAVAKDEILVELETDKITVEVAAQSAGVLGKIEKQEGDTVGVNELLGHLEEGAGPPRRRTAGGAAAAAPRSRARRPSPAARATRRRRRTARRPRRPRARSPPSTARPRLVKGTGPNGRVTKEDVLKAVRRRRRGSAREEKAAAAAAPAARPAPPAAPARPARARERGDARAHVPPPADHRRRLVEAQQTTASLTTFNEVDLSRVLELRKRGRTPS